MGRNRIENIAMCHEIAFSLSRLQQIILYDRYIGELKRSQAVEKIIMVPHYIDNLRTPFLHHLHQYLKEIGMLLFPAFTGFLQLPAIDDITIQNQSIAIYVLEKTGDLLRPGMFRSQMDIREDNSRIVLSCLR